MDIFDRIESLTENFIKANQFLLILLSGAFVAITLLTLFLTLYAGTIGVDYVYINITERHNAALIPTDQYISDDTMQSWDNTIIPVIGFLFQYQSILILIIAVGYPSFVIYMTIRYIYRRKVKPKELV
jgi:hypothetical protein